MDAPLVNARLVNARLVNARLVNARVLDARSSKDQPTAVQGLTQQAASWFRLRSGFPIFSRDFAVLSESRGPRCCDSLEFRVQRACVC